MVDIVWENFSNGLYVEGRHDAMPDGTMRRFSGVEPGCTTEIVSRNGSTLVTALASHSLFRFGDVRFQGSTTALYRAGYSIKAGLDGTRLTFVRAQPTVGVADYLFCAGGGQVFKVDSSGTVTNVGIVEPSTQVGVATGAAGVLTGDYLYKITFKNSVSGTRSNPNPVSGTVSPSSQQVSIGSIPVSTDSQVDSREIWRTQAGGSTFFLLTTISDNSTTDYTDNTADASLSSTELPVDNGDLPASTYEDVTGPHDGRVWWGRDTATGTKGRIYYSPPGRAEVIAGFIDITEDDDPVQKNIPWAGALYCFTEGHIFQVAGTGTAGIFTVLEVGGAPGTTQPHTVRETPFGIIYQAHDGVRIFDGATSRLLVNEPLNGIFLGNTREDIAGFEGVVATYTGKEYVISDTTTTLACDIESRRWRALGFGASAVYYEPDTGQLQVSFGSKTYTVEDAGVLSDDGTAITFEIQTSGRAVQEKAVGLVRRLYIDADTGGATLTPYLILDNSTITLPSFISSSRTETEWVIMRSGRVMAVRITGSLSTKVRIKRITLDVYIPSNQLSEAS